MAAGPNGRPLAQQNFGMIHVDPAQPRRWLVVEDEPFIALMISDQLVDLGHIVVGPAHDSRSAKSCGLRRFRRGAARHQPSWARYRRNWRPSRPAEDPVTDGETPSTPPGMREL
jgi:hypothetical protein